MFGRSLSLALLIAGHAAPALAQSVQERTFDFRLTAGSLDAALKRYARITGRQVLYRSATVRGRRFAGLTASLDADAALARILADTGLVITRPSPNVIVVDTAQAGLAASAEPDVSEEIVVTGSNIRNATPTVATRSISRRDIEASGRATVADVIAAQPANFGGTGNPVASLSGADRSSINSTVSPAADLRGLGSDATLTLFNGRRIAGSGGRGDFSDLSAIPTLAVDRIEILPDGASAIYGSDAVGGVVNLLLRRKMDGIEVRLRGGTTTEGRVRNALGGIATGYDWTGGSIFLAYEYEHRDPLPAAARDYTATGDLRPFGGSDRRTFYTSPGTILTFSPAVAGFVPAFRIPALPGGATPTVDQIVPGQNLGNALAGLDLSPRIDRHAVYGHIEHSIGDLTTFVDLRYNHRRFGYRSPASIGALVVTPANPFFLPVGGQPFNLIAYSFLPELGPVRTEGRVSSFGVTGGIDWQLDRWAIAAYGSFARERSGDRTDNVANPTAVSEALGMTPDDPATAFNAARDGFFNPYGSGRSNNPAILDFVGSGFAQLNRRSSIVDAGLKADGPIVRVGGGDIRVASGLAYRRETFRSAGRTFSSGNVPVDAAGLSGTRDIAAVFGELNLPIVGSGNAIAGLQQLILSAAIRHEEYDDFGATTNPKLGVAWSPTDGVTLRANWGTSFRAPALVEINERRTISPSQLPNGIGGFTPVIFVGGGNPDLGPERATTWSGGITLEPPPMPGFRIGLNLFSTRFRDRIAQPALQDASRALTDPALAPFVERVSPGTNAADLERVSALLAEPNAGSTEGFPVTAFLAIVDGRYINTGRLSVAGLDGDIAWSGAIGRNDVSAGLSATWLFRYDVEATSASPSVDRLDTLGNPAAIRVRGNLGWNRGPFGASLFGNWVNGYRDDGSVPYRSIDGFFTVDASVGVTWTTGLLRGTRLALSAENLLDVAPPFVDRVTGIGFDAANANPFGRTLALELRRTL